MRAARFQGEGGGGGGLEWMFSSGSSVLPMEYFEGDWDTGSDCSSKSDWTLSCLWSMLVNHDRPVGRV